MKGCKRRKPTVELDDDNFGAVLNCAVRYAVGRRTYMPYLVTAFILPLLPHLNDKTIWCFERDLADDRDYGDDCDSETWGRFREAVRKEAERRELCLESVSDAYPSTANLMKSSSASEDQCQRWISVKDRLPKPFEDVLTCLSGPSNTRFYTRVGWHADGKWYVGHLAVPTITDVQYWMPLPELPFWEDDTARSIPEQGGNE